MISGWLSSCGLRSIDLRRWGYVPHSRMFATQVDWAIKKSDVARHLADHGFKHSFELPGTASLRNATRILSDQNTELGEPVGPWTSIIIDRKRCPTVLFAFVNADDAVRTKLILMEHST